MEPGSGYYIPDIEYKHSGLDIDLDYYEYTQKESYYEIGGGMAISKVIELDEQNKLIPYGGVIVSILKGDEDYKVVYPDLGVTLTDTGDLENDGVLSLFVGMAYQFHTNWAARLEGRFLEESSISAGILFSF